MENKEHKKASVLTFNQVSYGGSMEVYHQTAQTKSMERSEITAPRSSPRVKRI
jgi:hypothetical protein